MSSRLTAYCADAARLRAFAALFAQHAGRGMTIHLQGALGAGKTTFARGLLHGLGYEGTVKSPTYTLVEPYSIRGQGIYHFDLYRLADAAELDSIGYRDYLSGASCILVEWPERATGLLGVADLHVAFRMRPPGRTLRCTAGTALGEQALAELKGKVKNEDVADFRAEHGAEFEDEAGAGLFAGHELKARP